MTPLQPPITFEGSTPAIATDVNTVIADIYYELNNLGGRGGYAYRSITGDSIRTRTITSINTDESLVTYNDSYDSIVSFNSIPLIKNPSIAYEGGVVTWGASLVEVSGRTLAIDEGSASSSVPLSTESWYLYLIIYDDSPEVTVGVSAKSEVSVTLQDGVSKWHMYHIDYNGGTPIITPIVLTSVIHANLIEAGTITADKLAADMIYTQNIQVGDIEVDGSGNYVSGSGLYADKTGRVVMNNVQIVGSAAGTQTYYQSSAPSPANEGDMWYCTDDWTLRRYNGSSWIAVSDITGNNTASNTTNVGTVSATNIAGWAYSGDTTKINGGVLQTGTVIADTVISSWVYAGNIAVSQIQAGTLGVGVVYAGNISADQITTGTLDASSITVTNLSANTITAGTLSVDRISTGSLNTIKLADNAVTDHASLDVTYYTVQGSAGVYLNNLDSNYTSSYYWTGIIGGAIDTTDSDVVVISATLSAYNVATSTELAVIPIVIKCSGSVSLVEHSQYTYFCIRSHTSSAGTEPGTTAGNRYWCPYDISGNTSESAWSSSSVSYSEGTEAAVTVLTESAIGMVRPSTFSQIPVVVTDESPPSGITYYGILGAYTDRTGGTTTATDKININGPDTHFTHMRQSIHIVSYKK